jgi:3-oxoacyl-[acyl-carrier-protein] synthase II
VNRAHCSASRPIPGSPPCSRGTTGCFPPTIGCEVQDDAIELDVVTKGPRTLPPLGDPALSNSFGFGGHNAVLALRRPG